MAQRTAKGLEEALMWIHINQHFAAGLEYDGDGRFVTHTWYKNHFDKLRIPYRAEWASKFFTLIRPNPRPHDDRMYALTPRGRRLLREFDFLGSIDWRAHP